MRFASIFSCFAMTVSFVITTSTATADPCGMVPPIDWAAQNPTIRTNEPTHIKRVGAQRTYVFYRNGLETLVLRPGFQGNVDEFGMLIPFPTPPAIRKVPDNVFEQIAAAIDPPEVVVDLRPAQGGYGAGFGGGGGGFGGGGGGFGGGGLGFEIKKDEVRVLREEAVGMYEVAVLAAGSDKALKRWMGEHKFVYPSGMDAVCPDYIKQRWCFVAVKTKVKQKRASDPRPGQRSIDNALPKAATFDGHVQAMGFRFRSPELVVPMRLSVHNSTKLHNVVYLLTDTPLKIRNIPEEFVRRQISGFKLFDQMTKPLPLRVLGGTIKDVPRATRIRLVRERDPEPHNGVAAELFASDLVAARTRQLENKSEAYEKDLFAINEALDLRGPDIDKKVQRQLRRTRARTTLAALKMIDDMTLTIVDGDFPRDVLARENLTFAKYQMPLHRSNREHYDANKVGRVDPTLGELYVGQLPTAEEATANHRVSPRITSAVPTAPERHWLKSLAILLGIGIVVGVVSARRSEHRRSVICGAVATLVVFGSLAVALAKEQGDAKVPALHLLIKRMADPSTAELAAEQIAKYGTEAVPALLRQSRSPNLVTRGWAIVALGKVGGDESETHLMRLHNSESVLPIVQTWAAAALIQAASTEEDLANLSRLAGGRPELNRGLTLAFRRLFETNALGNSVDSLLALGDRVSSLKPAIVEVLVTEQTRAKLDDHLQSQTRQQLITLASNYPQFISPITAEFCEQVQEDNGVDLVEARLVAVTRSSFLGRALGKDILADGSKPLLTKMLQSKDTSVRRTAAGYVATLGQMPANKDSIGQEVADAFKFDSAAKQPPWFGGPLFLPSVTWKQDQAKCLVGNLIRWHLWAERNADRTVQQQIDNYLQSLVLIREAGYTTPSTLNTTSWLASWKQVVGVDELRQLLVEQSSEADYKELLDE